MTIPTPPQHANFKAFKLAESSIMEGKLLSYMPEAEPGEEWGYRTMEEISGESKVNEAVQ